MRDGAGKMEVNLQEFAGIKNAGGTGNDGNRIRYA